MPADRPRNEEAPPPKTMEVAASELGLLIGINGTTIQRLIRATGCQIEVPRHGSSQDGNDVREVQLQGTPEQRRKAAAAIRDVLQGGDVDDHVGRCQGAMVVSHGFDNFDREAWTIWRLVPTECTHKVKVEMGRRNLRVWAEGRRPLTGRAVQRVLAEVEAAVEEARKLVELTLEAVIEQEPENANYDIAVSPLVDKYGVLVRVSRPEDGRVPLRIIGPAEAAFEAAKLLEARYVKGKSISSVLQVSGQVQSMEDVMAQDFANDVRNLEEEYRITVHQSASLLWLAGTSAESVATARETFREMLIFYFPKLFFLRRGLKSAFVEKMREDPELRVLTARPDVAVAFDSREGSIWICGVCRAAIEQRINVVLSQWEAEHWEHDLQDYGAAMYLLGPRGTGEYTGRIQAESGAAVHVYPVALKVCVEGNPPQVQQAKRMILDGLERLEKKKRAEAENGPEIKPKTLLSDAPPHMRAIMEKLAHLEEKKRVDLLRLRREEREREWALERGAARQQDQDLGQDEAGNAAGADGQNHVQHRDRSRSPHRQ